MLSSQTPKSYDVEVIMTKNEASWIAALLLGVDLLIAALNIHTTGNRGLDDFMNVDFESNFVTWYSSSKLFFCAIICWALSRKLDGFKWTLLSTSIAMICISMSESSMFHERFAGALDTIITGKIRPEGLRGMWVVYLSPIVVLVLVVLARNMLLLARQFPGTRAPLSVAFILWVIVLVAETAPTWGSELSPRILQWGMLLEEFSEMFGTTLLVYGMCTLATTVSGKLATSQEAGF